MSSKFLWEFRIDHLQRPKLRVDEQAVGELGISNARIAENGSLQIRSFEIATVQDDVDKKDVSQNFVPKRLLAEVQPLPSIADTKTVKLLDVTIQDQVDERCHVAQAAGYV